MYNTLNFNDGKMIWVTTEEANDLSQKLLNGDKFVKLDRIQKTFNASDISNVGINNVFFDPIVKGGSFSFSFNGLYAKNGEKEYTWNKGWKLSRGSFSLGMTFEDFISQMTVPA